ncbi:MAG: hypothetical protein B6U85_02515 [Desulfurococcales archaeon ex4484_42]|nr:MAG: hypothetical protein B6U85_02515 [Desulfurococcales archaeon ex4484_42]
MIRAKSLIALLTISLIVSIAYIDTVHMLSATYAFRHRVARKALITNTSLSLQSICKFLSAQFVMLNDGLGCLRESPIIEPNTCYIQTNWLCMHVLKYLCGYDELANYIERFLDRFIVDFYDYYQILLGKPFSLPLTTVKQVIVESINVGENKIIIKKLLRTNEVYYDYDKYANLIIYKAILNLRYGDKESTMSEVEKLKRLFDGTGFRDLSYKSLHKYETYKLALAIYLYRLLGRDYDAYVRRYVKLINSIKPFAILYDERLNGVGDFYIETACLTAIALYEIKDM